MPTNLVHAGFAALLFTATAAAAAIGGMDDATSPESVQAKREMNNLLRKDCADKKDGLKSLIDDPDTIVTVNSEINGFSVITRQSVDNFIARLQVAYLVEPDAFKDAIPKLAAASGMPQFVAELGIQSMLEGDAALTAKAVDAVMEGLRKRLGQGTAAARDQLDDLVAACAGYEELATQYDQILDAREAELKAATGGSTGAPKVPDGGEGNVADLGRDQTPVMGQFYRNIVIDIFGPEAGGGVDNPTPVTCRAACLEHADQCVMFMYFFDRAQEVARCSWSDHAPLKLVFKGDPEWTPAFEPGPHHGLDIFTGFGPKALELKLATPAP